MIQPAVVFCEVKARFRRAQALLQEPWYYLYHGFPWITCVFVCDVGVDSASNLACVCICHDCTVSQEYPGNQEILRDLDSWVFFANLFVSQDNREGLSEEAG